MLNRRLRNLVIVLTVLTVSVGPAVLALQLPPTGPPASQRSTTVAATGVISGRVVEGLTTTGVAGAVVTLSEILTGARRAILTDTSGSFTVSGLSSGSYSFTAEKSGYVFGTYAQRRPFGRGRSLVLAQAGRRTDVHVPLWKEAAISGTLVDEAGEPIVGHRVEAWSSFPIGGRLLLENTSAEGTLTDDRGVYRLAGLSPGSYAIVVPSVQANTAKGLTPFYASQFYQGARSASAATPVEVQSGEVRRGTDFRLVPTRMQRVSGRLEDPSGLSTGNLVVTLTLVDELLGTELEEATTVSRSDGAFVLEQVPVGSYTLKVLRQSLVGPQVTATPRGFAVSAAPPTRAEGDAPAPMRWALVPLVVGDQPISDLRVVLAPGSRIAGQLVFEGDLPPPPPDRLRRTVMAIWMPSGRRVEGVTGTAVVSATETGAFETSGLPPGRYFVQANAPMGWTIKSMTLAGRDVSTEPITLAERDVSGLVVTMTDKVSTVTGVVSGPNRMPDDEATVLIFPVQPSLWLDSGQNPLRLRSVRAGDTGQFTVSGLPPGEYFFVAAKEEFTAAWQTQNVLDQLSRVASRVNVGVGDQLSVSLLTISRLGR